MKVFVGIDPGGSDATAQVIVGLDEDGKYHVLSAWTGSGQPPMMRLVQIGDLSIAADNWPADLEWKLRQRGLSEEHIQRVLRLNPKRELGARLRGLRLSETRFWGWPSGLVQKGQVLRTHGRDVWAAIPRTDYRKDGRRVWVSEWKVQDAVRRVRG